MIFALSQTVTWSVFKEDEVYTLHVYLAFFEFDKAQLGFSVI